MEVCSISIKTELNLGEYIERRLNEQIEWYDKKSNKSQSLYKWLQRIEIVAAASIPLLSGYVSSNPIIPITVSVSGTVIVICAAISRLGKYHEKWLQYRATCELLKHEKYLFLTSTSPYEDQPFQLLVERAESIISAENINWSQLATSDDKK